ncbi:MAG: TrbI/VirB10 family protein [Marinobacter sp.]|nr:TrbI/VirB10 family protein [Marinobacter sp.]
MAELTYDEYRRAIGAGQERLDHSRRLVGHDQLHNLVPGLEDVGTLPEGAVQLPDGRIVQRIVEVDIDTKRETGTGDREDGEGAGTEMPATPGQSSQVSESGRSVGATSVEQEPQRVEPAQPAPRAATPRPPDTTFISPSLRQTGGPRQTNRGVVVRSEGNQVRFGIPVGSSIRVRLDRSASNVQPGAIALAVEETIRGRQETLPAGSTLFARASAVLGSESLYLTVFQGITPDGKEFQVTGHVFTDAGEPGLVARVVSDGRSLARATARGTNTLGRELLSEAPLGAAGVGGAAAEATLDQILRENERSDDAALGRPAYVVVAQPQRGVVQIERTF